MVHAVRPGEGTAGGRHLPEAYRDGWLLFVGAGRRYRVAPVPADWLTCPISDLLRLLSRAEVADRGAGPAVAEPPVLRFDGGDPDRA